MYQEDGRGEQVKNTEPKLGISCRFDLLPIAVGLQRKALFRHTLHAYSVAAFMSFTKAVKAVVSALISS